MDSNEAIERALRFRRRALEETHDTAALTWILMAKSIAIEAGLVSLMCDLMADVGRIRERINKSRGVSAPVMTFGGANMSPQLLMRHGR